ncbi:intein-containing Rv2578c family radical SAM protein [Cellulomonas sp. McL0617]|uniref:intein-containing Rv2578c family radical SAM protein n=1 Tax=Cellulomonas sp. McL0617 TaxID=3415675 RepID=UPI003CED1756
MRWDGQKLGTDDATVLPGLAMAGLQRSVRTPEFAGVTFHEVTCKSALNKVPAASAMPFRWTVNPTRGCLHACSYCLDPTTRILMADGRERALGDIAIGDEIMGTRLIGRYRRYDRTVVSDVWHTRKRTFRVTLEDGTVLVASGDHRFLTTRGWKHVTGATSGRECRPHLTTNDKLLGFGVGLVPAADDVTMRSTDFRRGYLAGMIRGDGTMLQRTYTRQSGRPDDVSRFRLALADSEALDRSQQYLSDEGVATYRRLFGRPQMNRRPMSGIFTSRTAHHDDITGLIAWPPEPSVAWRQGYLSGLVDAEGSCSRGVLRISNSDPAILAQARQALSSLGIPHVQEPARQNGVANIRVTGGLAERRRFFAQTSPAITRKLDFVGMEVTSTARLRVVSIEDLEVVSDLIDITTATGDFIANGVISHNCFARPTHEYLELNAGRDFETQIVVKTNVVDVLRAELHRPSWQREHVALGTNTDPYQRVEGRYRLMPGIIDALAGSGTPLSILTKGTLLRRDLPLLAEVQRTVPVGIGVSLAIGDEALQQAMEPGTPTPRARLELIRAVREAGLPCGVMVAPVLPWLTDDRARLDALLAELAAAGATGVTVLPLHLRGPVKPLFLAWLGEHAPALVHRYEALYGRGAYVPQEYARWLERRVRPLLVRHGFEGRDRRAFRRQGEGAYPEGSVVADAGLPALELPVAAAQPVLF